MYTHKITYIYEKDSMVRVMPIVCDIDCAAYKEFLSRARATYLVYDCRTKKETLYGPGVLTIDSLSMLRQEGK